MGYNKKSDLSITHGVSMDEDNIKPVGKTTIAPEVLVSIAQMTALGVPGISRLSNVPTKVNRWLDRGSDEGVHIDVEDGMVFADLYVIVECDVKVREVAEEVQGQVARAISDMVGMDVGNVNIHIEDIDYPVVTAD